MTQQERTEFFNTNINLAYSLALKHWGTKYIDEEDMKQWGLSILWDLAESYDPLKGAPTTYITAFLPKLLTKKVIYYYFDGFSRSSNFIDALTVVTKSYNNDSLETMKLTSASKAIIPIIYANLQGKASLSDSKYTNRPSEEGLCLEDTLVDTCTDVENRALQHDYTEYLYIKLHTDFIDYCMQKQSRGTVPGQLYRKLLHTFVDSVLSGEKCVQKALAEEYKVSTQMISKLYRRFIQRLQEYSIMQELFY